MPLKPYFLRVACIGLGLVWALPGLSEVAATGERGQGQPSDWGGPGVVVHARLPVSVLTVRARVAPTCLVTVAVGIPPSIHCTRGIAWQAGVGGDAPTGWPEGAAAIAAEWPSDACGTGTPTASCLIVEF